MYFNGLLKEKTSPGLCCLYLLPDKLIITHALYDQEKGNTISFIEMSAYQPDSLKLELTNIIKKHGFNGVDCTWVLDSSYYQLFFLDPPSVSENEIPLALRWQVKELINFPTHEASIEYFSIPATVSSKQKIGVAVAKKAVLQSIADTIHEVGFKLKYIDIAELALRNINALYGDDNCYLGLLAFHHNHIEFIITNEKNLLLSRRLPIPETTNSDTLPAEWLSGLIEEIQRSFSYCKNQQQKDIPAKLLVSTTITELVTHLNGLLDITTEQLNIESKINFEFAVTKNEYLSLDYLIGIGGALREHI